MELRKLCVYDRTGGWVDIVRLYEMPCDGVLRYVVRHMEEEDMWVFDRLKDALEFISRELVAVGPLYAGECPP
jgi:hypothetical protein